MPRIRNIKPRFWDSPDTAKADLAPRLLYMALWNWADDSGRGTANLKELEAFAFPHDTVAELPRRSRGNSAAVWPSFGHILAEVQDCYGVVFYRVSSRNYFEIPSFKDHQSKNFKPDSTFPSPDEGEIWDLTSEFADSTPQPASSQGGESAEIPQPVAEIPRLAAVNRPLDRDEDGDRDGDTPTALRTEPHSEPEPTAAASATPGAQLVRENIRGNHPSATLTALRIQASELLRTGTEPSTVAAALQLWNDKPSVGIGRTILASLCSEVIKTANGAPATGSKPSKLRKTVSLAQRVRAQENAHLATAARLELE